jgi:predicted O-methyltransferase YrrM
MQREVRACKSVRFFKLTCNVHRLDLSVVKLSGLRIERRDVGIYSKSVSDYLKRFEPARNHVLIEIERACKERGLEPIPPEVGAFLAFLVWTCKRKHVLEIGTCLGYSAIWMAQRLPSDGLIETIEVDRDLAANAEKNFGKAGVSGKIRILRGLALDILPTLKRDYDLVFIDALKKEYPEYLEHSLHLLEEGGVIVADDVLLGELGWGDDASKKALHEFNRKICFELNGMVLPVGDGLALATV